MQRELQQIMHAFQRDTGVRLWFLGEVFSRARQGLRIVSILSVGSQRASDPPVLCHNSKALLGSSIWSFCAVSYLHDRLLAVAASCSARSAALLDVGLPFEQPLCCPREVLPA